tara:strand:- start:848 stop:1306 length:459 start_codon:yes stop_codon:yes gene_type:complete
VKTVKLIIIFFFLIGCATPEVVNVKDPLDDKKNCNELESSVAEAQKFKRDALFEKENTGGNIARMILFWPAMATTFHNSDKAIRAANDRTFHLLKIMKKKNCKNIDLVNSEILKNSTQTIVGELKMLKDLYKSGDLTKEEFTKAKKKVLESE